MQKQDFKEYLKELPLEIQIRNANYAIRFLFIIIVIESLFLIF